MGTPEQRSSVSARRAAVAAWLLALSVLAQAGCAGVGEARPGAPPHHRERGFANVNPEYRRPDFWTLQRFRVDRLWRWATGQGREVAPYPRVPNDGRALRDNGGEPTITWVGHATLLVQLQGVNVLTDPQWAERASPFSWAGPRRLTPVGLAFEDLPPIHVVVISHDHYDSLDVDTIRRLAATHRPRFLVPLGLKAWMADIGVTDVEELDWWDSRLLHGLSFTCVPAQHWSARTPFDADRRLWSGWVVAGNERRFYFAGDTGYYQPMFREIADRLGPIDLAAIPIGAYLPQEIMQFSHITPEQAVQIFLDVRARVLVPQHYGTFDLADEPFEEPPVRLGQEARRLGLGPDRVWILRHGETRAW
jgi:L-ascorbate metabolism protein UlaG (beta-lactamase superfamily)